VSQFVRYRGYLRRGSRAKEASEVTRSAQRMLEAEKIDLAVIAGLGQRMGYLLTGGALGLLQHTELKVTPKHLVLKLNDKADTLNADVIGEALKGLAKALGREALVESA
jgi:hypothetical protein